jgi:glycosyltransferase involved in cell wall biosynthesis
LLGTVMGSARLVAVHGTPLARARGEAFPGRPVEALRMGVAEADGDGAAARARLGLPPDAILFAAFGRVTPEKRIDPVLAALAHTLDFAPEARLVLVGETAEYYDVVAAARAAGVADRVTITGFVPDDDLGAFIRAADACLCLRWPTGRETSASWLRCLSAGRPTIITELVQHAAVPVLDPRSWTVLEGAADSEAARPVAVAIDILDEQHSLGLAMRRLATDAMLRRDLGAAARAHWAGAHTLAHLAGDYARALARAAVEPLPDRSALPPHLLDDGTRLARAIAAEIGVALDLPR